MKRIVFDRGLCDGNGLCAQEAPDVFMLDENDELRLLREEVEDNATEAIERAVAVCPKAALRIGT